MLGNTYLKDRLTGKVKSGESRSPKWPEVRDAFLKENPTCAVCGERKKLQAHHKYPFHLWPNLELESTNLITLCETTSNHHLLFGHLMNWRAYNVNVVLDAKQWWIRIKSRPYDKS
jgi:5-methylcytosine-specific restriction endonuclease McrA